jgi:predicted transcriptional regulator
MDDEEIRATGIPQAVVEAHVLRALPIIRAWREHMGITQGELAVRMGVSQAAIAKLEKPNAKPRRVTLEKIAKALGISITQLDV